MNKTYRSIWNEQTGTFVAVSENAAARGKKALRKTRVALVLSAIAMTGTGMGTGSTALAAACETTLGHGTFANGQGDNSTPLGGVHREW
jgi:hypothetical protein